MARQTQAAPRTLRPPNRLILVSTLLAALTLVGQPAGADNGDCSIPVSDGRRPTTSDCLKILNVAVELEDCSPHEDCICAPKGTLPTTSTDAQLCLAVAVQAPGQLTCQCSIPTSTTVPPPVTTSTTSTTSTTIPVGPICGNGIIEDGEQCDGRNGLIDDCCSPSCMFETGTCTPVDRCSTGDICSRGNCTGGTPLPDVGEPNDRISDAFDLGDLTSGDGDAATLEATLHPRSQDWFHYHVSDEVDSVVDPTASPTVVDKGPTIEFCLYYSCDEGTTALDCPVGTSPDFAGEAPGCCSLGGDISILPNCEGTSDDSGTAIIQVRHVNPLKTCTSYTVGYRG